MIGDLSALKLSVIQVNLLLQARDCLASARTEERYISEQEATSELPPQE